MSGVNNDPSINILDRVKSLKSYNLEFWMSGVKNDPSIQTLYGIEQYYSKFYNNEWVRRLPAQITTIMNEWCLQWLQDYDFEWVESTLIPASTLSTEWSNITQNSIILNEL